MNDITKPSDLTLYIITNRVYQEDTAWIMFQFFLGNTWTIKGDKNDNRKNVYLSVKEYWKGTY